MDDDAIILVVSVVGAGVGALVAFSLPGASEESIILVALVIGAGGTVVGYMIAALSKTLRRQSRQDQPRIVKTPPSTPRDRSVERQHRVDRHPDITPPKPFRERLANYTHREPSQVMTGSDTFQSKMPFWSAVDYLSQVPPKSARIIRRYLVAIRRALSEKRSG